MSRTIVTSEDEIKEIAPDPKGKQIALVTDSVSHRFEDPKHNEIYLVSSAGGPARRLTNNLAIENGVHWSPDGSKIFFHVGAASGAIDGPYRDVQGRLYVLDPANGAVKRLGAGFAGSFEDFDVMGDGRLIATGLKGTEQQLYAVNGDRAVLLPGLPGTYSAVDIGLHTPALLVKHSTLIDPAQVFLAADPASPRTGEGDQQLQSAVHATSSAGVEDLSVEGRRRRYGGRGADLPAAPDGGKETAHADAHPRRPGRGKWQLLRSRLVRVGNVGSGQWLAGLPP